MSVLVLIIVHLIPLYGVFVLGWQADNLLTLYWLESGVIGIVTIIKLIRAETYCAFQKAKAQGKSDVYFEGIEGIVGFLLSYGVLWSSFGIILFILIESDMPRNYLDISVYKWNLIAIVLGQIISFKLDFLDNSEYTVEPEYIKKTGFVRIVVLLTAFILGGFWGDSTFLLILLIALRIIVDVVNQIIDKRVNESTIVIQGSKKRILLSRSDFKK